MVRISEDLVRRKAEHNDKEISSLEELSLHQENIEQIEHLQNWCRNLQILLLQSNLIPRIENLGKLKKLTYLNLALNNIEKIENLEGLESLEKLDLTLNFIGDLHSVSGLGSNVHLKQLILTGNPCADFKHYRAFTVTKLQQIQQLDCQEVTRSERISAGQCFEEKVKIVKEQERVYKEKRKLEKTLSETDDLSEDDNDDFWNQPSKNTPEERIKIAKRTEKNKKKEEEEVLPIAVKLFGKEGQPLNINQTKIPFSLQDNDETAEKILDLAVYKYLDTNLIDVDIHPKYVTVRIKNKIFQITFDDEVAVERSVCQRSETTGHLVIKMPIINKKPKLKTKREPLHNNCDKLRTRYLDVVPIRTTREICTFVRDEDTGHLNDDDIPPLV